ncbi:LysR family transcriptional regulator [Parendozoicomonas haliclonae]|uniref:HTH-type transcriptional regulator CynR n=1 Tax=Parendozoicomonas haliclonae TaxID=1960125 RepID=A0A1X7AS47_9GAMM|nr:LysR family transcriptional regulator [Parendozoicomonas haliclonae]SMA50918.1 HTH-type transcriptional regulator CynR [Parendozoicomonas haliclonae]
MIDISDIHMIRVVTELGSINKAADALNMSQPTLSKKISRLEQKIGIEFFNRDSAGMVATPAAEFLIREGNDLKQQLQAIEHRLTLMSDMIGGTVRVGVGPIIEQHMLPKVLLDFADRDYPFKISVTTMAGDVLLKQLMKGQIDLAVGPFMDEDVPDGIDAPLKTADKLVVVVRKEHALAKLDSATVDDLARFKIITPNIPKSLGSRVIEYIGTGFQPTITCENYTMAKTIVNHSDYVTVGPEHMFHNEFASGELVKLELPYQIEWHSLCLVKPENLLMPVIKEVVDLFGQYMEPTRPL